MTGFLVVSSGTVLVDTRRRYFSDLATRLSETCSSWRVYDRPSAVGAVKMLENRRPNSVGEIVGSTCLERLVPSRAASD